MQYGYVHLYGLYDNRYLLQFSKTGKPAQFAFTNENALQLVDMTTLAKRCITRKTDGDEQLILTGNCSLEQWVYNSTSRHLKNMKAHERGCFSPWDYLHRLPADLDFTAGISKCSDWNQIILEAGEYRVYIIVTFWHY